MTVLTASGPRAWLLGARPRTLSAAVVPVLVGTAVARSDGAVTWWRVVAALVVSVAIQVGTNYANDYSDGIRGTDEVRVGPVRLVAGGLATPAAVKRAALLCFGIAAIVGLVVAAATSPLLVLVGAACLLAGWYYTGGRRPYGYAGLGEPVVFVFFGPVATAGTAYVARGSFLPLGVAAGVPVGLLAVAILIANNLRDIGTDAEHGKRTLAVRLGERVTRKAYVGAVALPFPAAGILAVAWPGALLTLLALPLVLSPARSVYRGAAGRELVPVLVATARLQLTYGVLLTIGLLLGG